MPSLIHSVAPAFPHKVLRLCGAPVASSVSLVTPFLFLNFGRHRSFRAQTRLFLRETTEALRYREGRRKDSFNASYAAAPFPQKCLRIFGDPFLRNLPLVGVFLWCKRCRHAVARRNHKGTPSLAVASRRRPNDCSFVLSSATPKQRLRLCPHFVVIDNSQDCFCNSPLAERTS